MDISQSEITKQQADAAKFALDQHSLVSMADLTGTITYVNEKFTQVSGYSAQELLGKKHNILNSGKHSKAFWQRMHNQVLNGEVWQGEVRNRAKCGTFYWVDTTIVPNFDEQQNVVGFTSIRTDITEQKRNIEQLAIAKQQAEAAKFALDQHSLVSMADLSGTITYVNEKFVQISGYSAGELLGNKHNILNSGKHSKAFWQEMHSTVLAGYVWHSEVCNRAKNGKYYWVDTTIVPNYDAEHEVIGFTSIRTDITEQKKVIEQLAIAKREAESATKAKEDFLANMSHEIRTPMNGVYASLQLLSQSNMSVDDRKLVNNALFSSKSLLTIINDILDFSKVDAGKLDIEHIEFDFNQVLESVCNDIMPEVEQGGIDFCYRYTRGIEANWLGDPVRVKQILLNLVSNAVKFTSQGLVEILISPLLEKIESENKKPTTKGLIIEVNDTGIGMSDDAVKRIFDRFSQADTSTTRKFGGTGLGMAITLSLIELMGGEIHVNSKLEKGTKIKVVLPLEVATKSTKDESSTTQTDCPVLAGKRILIADDNPINKVIFNKILVPTQAQLFEAQHGEEAIEIALGNQPDLIFMDIQMPVMDGVTAFKQLRSQGFTAPIIAFTANVLEHDIEQYMEIGFNGCVSKPVDIPEVYKLLSQLL